MLKHIFVLSCILYLVIPCNAQDRTKLTSLSLDSAIEIAIKKHPDLQKSQYSIAAAKGRYLREISLPPLSLSVTNEGIPKGADLSGYDERNIEISQSFDFPTIYFSKGARANAEINSLGSQNTATLNSIKTSVKRAYFTTLAKFQILKIAEENLEIAGDFFKKAELRYKVGEATNLELLTSKNQLSEAKALIESSKKEYKTALTELICALGNSVEIDYNNIQFSDSLKYTPFKSTLEEITSKSLNNNPVLKAASYELEVSDINKSLAWSSLLPSFNIGYLAQNLGGGNYYGVKFGVNLPIWFMLDQTGQINEADANYQVATYQMQSIKNNILQKINSAYIDFQYDEKQVALYVNELNPQIEEIFRTANLSYQVGEITYLEYLQAKFTTLNSKINYVKTLFDYQEALINLEESTGLSLE